MDPLHNHLDYIPEKGILINKRSGKSGYVRKADGMVIVTAKGKQYLAHRVIFFFERGYLPEFVDHIDGNRQNNHISNLREATRSVNNQNRHGPTSRSSTGVLGVFPSGKKFMAKVVVNKKHVYLGTFSTKEEASNVYLTARRQLLEGNTL